MHSLKRFVPAMTGEFNRIVACGNSVRFSVRALEAYQSRPELLKISDEVSASLLQKRPVVALESTIITHGMPFPKNVQTAMEVEKIIRENGAVPATISIIKGKINVGTSENDLIMLAERSSKPNGPVKVSRRDFPRVLSAKLDGGTTVAGTMIVADLAGIRIFVTGGIGGVHRNGEQTMDVSADLVELGRTPVCVVSSGVKSILDIGRTLEFLETQGVCVATLGSKEFPAFYTRTSGFNSPCVINSTSEAASMLKSALDLNLKSGLLIAVPIPENDALNSEKIEEAIKKSLDDADRQGVRGKEVTPFILSEVARATAGNSLLANIALIKNNAKAGAEIAVKFSEMCRGLYLDGSRSEKVYVHGNSGSEIRPVVIGGSNMDSTVKVIEDTVKMNGSTHASKVVKSWGGVGRNIAECLHRLGAQPILLTALGEDAHSKNFDFECRSPEPKKGSTTSSYTAILDSNGECLIGFGDMDLHETITPEWIMSNRDVIKNAPLIVMDGNVPIPSMSCILELAHTNNIPVFFEPTDIRKATKPFNTKFWQSIKFITPNVNELEAIANRLDYDQNKISKDELKSFMNISKHMIKHIDNVLITMGEKGVLLVTKNDLRNPFFFKIEDKLKYNITGSSVNQRFYTINNKVEIINVSGAGDCLAGGFIYSMLKGKTEDVCMSVAFNSALTSLTSNNTVPEKFFNENDNCWKIGANFETL